MGDDLSVVNRGEHRAGEKDGNDADDKRWKRPTPPERQDHDGHNRDDRGPGKDGSTHCQAAKDRCCTCQTYTGIPSIRSMNPYSTGAGPQP